MTSILNDLLRQPFFLAIGWSLVHFLWQGTLLVVVVRAILLGLPRASARLRYAVACTGLLGMAVLPVATGVGLYAPAGALASAEVGAAAEQPSAGAAPAPVEEGVPGPVMSREVGRTGGEGWIGRLQSAVRPWLSWVVVVWLVGVALLSIRLVGGWLQLQRLRTVGTRPVPAEWERALTRLAGQVGVSRPVRLLESLRVEVPSVIGALKPVVLLPVSVLTGLPPRDVELIIAHELAHVRRHDYLVNLLQALVETVLFYHPGVWYLSGVIREERENCCDDLVVQATGAGRRYARVLLEAEELRWSTPPLGAPAVSGGTLYRRVRRLVARPAEGPDGAGVAGVAALLVVAAVMGAGIRPAIAATGAATPTGRVEASGPGAGLPAGPEAQGGLAARWSAARNAARENGWSTYWIGYAVRPAAGTRVVASNGPAGGEGEAAPSAVSLAGGAGGAAVRLAGPPAPTDAVFFFRMAGGSDVPLELMIRAADAPAEIGPGPVAWIGVAPDAESLALLERVRASASEEVRKEIGPAAALHGDARTVVAFIRQMLSVEPSPEVRAEAAFWLQHQPTAASLALLEEVVRRDASPEVREEAVTGIARMNTDEARRLLQRLSDDTTLPLAVRQEAMDWRVRGGGGS